MQPIRLLILGTGSMAQHHATHFAKIPGVTLVGGVDPRPEQLAAFADTTTSRAALRRSMPHWPGVNSTR